MSYHGADLRGGDRGGPSRSLTVHTNAGGFDGENVCARLRQHLREVSDNVSSTRTDAACCCCGGAAARPHRGDDVFEGVKARQHREDLLRPVCHLGQLQRQRGGESDGCLVAAPGGRPPVGGGQRRTALMSCSNEPSRKLVWRYRIRGRSNRFLPQGTSEHQPTGEAVDRWRLLTGGTGA